MCVTNEIERCGDCIHLGKKRYYTADSWEHVVSWYCKKTDRQEPPQTDRQPFPKESSLIGFVERPSEEPKKIPKWCPLR